MSEKPDLGDMSDIADKFEEITGELEVLPGIKAAELLKANIALHEDIAPAAGDACTKLVHSTHNVALAPVALAITLSALMAKALGMLPRSMRQPVYKATIKTVEDSMNKEGGEVGSLVGFAIGKGLGSDDDLAKALKGDAEKG